MYQSMYLWRTYGCRQQSVRRTKRNYYCRQKWRWRLKKFFKGELDLCMFSFMFLVIFTLVNMKILFSSLTVWRFDKGFLLILLLLWGSDLPLLWRQYWCALYEYSYNWKCRNKSMIFIKIIMLMKKLIGLCTVFIQKKRRKLSSLRQESCKCLAARCLRESLSIFFLCCEATEMVNDWLFTACLQNAK